MSSNYACNCNRDRCDWFTRNCSNSSAIEGPWSSAGHTLDQFVSTKPSDRKNWHGDGEEYTTSIDQTPSVRSNTGTQHSIDSSTTIGSVGI
jgi:hypothetical protein